MNIHSWPEQQKMVSSNPGLRDINQHKIRDVVRHISP
jgi:hypothetical protein